MSIRIDAALAYLFQNEGTVYTNDPADSGGPTKYGVTMKSYLGFVGRAVTAGEIEHLSIGDVGKFYRARYWGPLRCEEMTDAALAIAIFDAGVLYGVRTAGMMAQAALARCGFVLSMDGVIGPKTLAALAAVDRVQFLEALHLYLLDRIETLVKLDPKNARFRDGWTNRAARILTLNADVPFNRGKS